MLISCRNLLSALLSVALLAGCTNAAYRESRELAAQGRLEDSLTMLQIALRDEPTNAEIRSATLLTRDRLTQGWMNDAEAAHAAGDAGRAEESYRRVLAVDAAHPRARAGLDALVRDRRHQAWLKEAEAAAAKKEFETATARLRQILAENPRHDPARALQNRLEEKLARPVVDAKTATALLKPISIEYRDAPIQQVFEVFARVSGLNFVFDKDVRPDLKATVFLRNTTVKDAMNLILMTNQLESRVMETGSVVIYPNTPAKAREYQQMIVKTFFLANAEAKQAANTIKTLLKTRDLVIDEKQNMLIMRDSPDAIRLAEKLLLLQDLPEPEVMLEVEILEVKRSSLLDLGIQWPTQLALTPLAGAKLSELKGLPSDRIGASLSPLVVNAKKVDGDSNTLANPRIRVRNREKAKVMIGSRVPNITSTISSGNFSQENIQYIDVGLKLEVEPTIYLDNEVAIRVTLEVSNIVGTPITTTSGSRAYEIGTRTTTTVLRLRDNENQILAGLINDEDRRSASKVPGFGDIPLLGRLFANHNDDQLKSEIILSITPRIVRNIVRPELANSEFDTGTEAGLRSVSADAGSAGAAQQAAGVAGGSGTTVVPVVVVAPAGAATSAAPGTAASASGSIAGTSAGDAGTTTEQATNAMPARLQWVGGGTASPGQTFTVQLAFRSDLAVAAIPINLSFNPKAVEVLAVQEGDFMRQGGGSASTSSQIDRENGLVTVNSTRSSGTVSGSGTLLSVTLRGITPSTSALSAFVPPLSSPTSGSFYVETPQPLNIVIK